MVKASHLQQRQQQAENTPLLEEDARPSDIPRQSRQRKTSVMYSILKGVLAILVVFFIIVVVFLVVVASKAPRSTRKLPDDGPSGGELGIGLHLTTSYATAALAYANGTTIPIFRAEVSGEYREMMSRLSLLSSEHLHLPYNNVAESISDYTRQLHRRARETLGLPASPDVGRLSQVISELRSEVELILGQKITSAAITIPSIVALYEEDLRDAFAHSELTYVEIFPYNNHRRIHDTGALYAGLGLPPSEPSEREFYLVVQYTRNCLITSQAEVSTTYDAEEHPHFENFSLGFNHVRVEEKYWERVAVAIQRPVKESYIPRRIARVLVHGESSGDPVFREVVERAVRELEGVEEGVVPVYAQDGVFVAARGVAELGRRALAGGGGVVS
ncbi:hypothetical protein F5884DRAFT_854664 [Xylogone sp. PMI_703]|nr:hypothetical protein F5884DRAFT_854664 [Xylogone sp. PMI_703]